MRTEYIPVPNDPWNEVAPGLFVGGHLAQADCHPNDQFDMVVSLVDEGPDWAPTSGVHVVYEFPDAVLDPTHLKSIHALVDLVAQAYEPEFKVLVRCSAGLNRSALIAGLALRRRGWTAYQAEQILLRERSPHCLSNWSFATYLATADVVF